MSGRKLFPPRGGAAAKPPRQKATTPEETIAPPSTPSVNYDDLHDPYEPKTCFNPQFLWKKKPKIASVDVASVGNASDTLVSVVVDAPRNSSNSSQSTSPETSTVGGKIRCSGRELHELAKATLNAGDYTQALDYFEAILSAQLSRFGPLHPSVGAAMHNVGVCRLRMNQPQLAANLFQEAIQIREATLGPSHIEVAASLSKLGTAHAALKQFEDAYRAIRKALRIAQDQLGYVHKTTAQMLCHLACFYFESGELYAAQATFQDAYEIYKAIWPTALDRDTCMAQMTDTLCNIGSIQNKRKRYKESIQTFSEALDLQMGIFGIDHARVIATLDNLAYAYSKNKEYEKSLSCYKKMFKSQSKNEFTQACVDTFRKQVVMLEKLKQQDEAIEVAKDTLRLAKVMLPRNDPMIACIKDVLEDLLKKRKKTAAI